MNKFIIKPMGTLGVSITLYTRVPVAGRSTLNSHALYLHKIHDKIHYNNNNIYDNERVRITEKPSTRMPARVIYIIGIILLYIICTRTCMWSTARPLLRPPPLSENIFFDVSLQQSLLLWCYNVLRALLNGN